ncbi:PTS mannose transporter subunit IIA [Enterococcus cecorum]|uniref:PTS mannose transporter subunit IIA n=1 Tax=Enterococcus cecorum TaxID=44008 RepID=A0AAP6MBJ4_9ENTE|nr:PTS mannose transporter subunit IIA [Enterococcus cecorum]KLO64522.1 PTS mannose transporter subunit IIA [Enterococcus cecorum]KLO69417.1 PTS mannose transporter subunit IIA [Enterococcus cecorum]MDM8182732.1 PTS mannose transporter subunit IIA [Enterococcus cecorum]MDZ5504014.1 PTS mannose transporter subunit IIA [Enterococcus cecorum]MDZ5531203.1 PTS mannose transporter subunit IIA [Enterococcus cecorum]
MKYKIILATHGNFASGILSSFKLIYGNDENIEAIDCYTTENFDLSSAVSEILNEYKNDTLIVITDIFGGSVNNEFLQRLKYHQFYLVSGLNLPFLIELVSKLSYENKSIDLILTESIQSSCKTIKICNHSLNEKIIEEEF